jgi:hypothetical protein
MILWQFLFVLSSGPVRRFKRVCELIQSLLNARSVSQISHRKISSDLSTSSASSYGSERSPSLAGDDEVSTQRGVGEFT